MFTNSFAGIEPASVPAFITFQVIGAAIAIVVIRVLYPEIANVAAEVVLPHPTAEVPR